MGRKDKMMQIEFRYNGQSKRKSLTLDCSMDDILSAFGTLYEIDNADAKQSFDIELFNDDTPICLEDPSNQLFEGAIIDITEAKSKQQQTEEDDTSNTDEQSEENKETENEQEEATVSPNIRRKKKPRFVARL